MGRATPPPNNPCIIGGGPKWPGPCEPEHKQVPRPRPPPPARPVSACFIRGGQDDQICCFLLRKRPFVANFDVHERADLPWATAALHMRLHRPGFGWGDAGNHSSRQASCP